MDGLIKCISLTVAHCISQIFSYVSLSDSVICISDILERVKKNTETGGGGGILILRAEVAYLGWMA